MAPRLRKKTRRRKDVVPDKSQDEVVEELFLQMESHMALDRILEARKEVDEILEKYPKITISSKRQQEMDHIIEESNHVKDMLHDLQTDEDWTMSSSRKGVTVHYRHVQGTPIHAVKTHCIFEDFTPTDFVHLCSLFVETDLMPLWFPNNILDSVTLLAEPSKYRQILQSILKFHHLPFADRELIAEGIGYHLQDENALLVLTKSIDSSPYCEIPPPSPKPVRMETRMAFFIKILPGNRIEFSQIAHDNLKLRFMPAFVLNYISQGAVPFELTQSIQRVLKDFNGSKWEKRIQSRRDFYLEIKSRIHEQVAAVLQEEESTRNVSERPRPTKGSTRSTGMPLWKAVSVMCSLVAIARCSYDTIQLPLLVYVAFLSPMAAVLTHWAYLHERSQV